MPKTFVDRMMNDSGVPSQMVLPGAVKRIVAMLTATVFTLLATVTVDRFVGVVRPHEQMAEGIIFTPNSDAQYETADFTFTAEINSLGFRDREFKPARAAEYRVIAIGDSYTYGWGVDLEDSWPKVLEGDLKQHGMDVEVANLGAPGASPVKYADVAEKAIPLLKPDLVVVAILQGDDLEQLKFEQPSAPNTPKSVKETSLLKRMMKRLYPNLSSLAAELRHEEKANRVTAEWRLEAQTILSHFDPSEMKRYQQLDPKIKAIFESGMLNPPLIQSAIKRPNYWLDTFDVNNPDVQQMIRDMAVQLRRIRKVADEYHAKVMVVSVPMGIYVDSEIFEMRKNYGFALDKRMLVSDAEDIEIKMAADSAGLPFLAVTDQFRQNHEAHFFFRLDTHLNSKGHHFFGDLLAPKVEHELKSKKRRIGASASSPPVKFS